MATLKEPFALDRSLNTTEVTPRNIADVLAEGLSHITGRTASEVEYDNTDSGLTADNVQGAIDELSERPTLPSVDIQTAVDEFSTYNGGLLSECKVALSPNQDLHGYDNPWVGGAGKNKLPINENTISGVGFIFDTPIDLPSGTWTFSFVSTVTSNSSFAVLDGDGNVLANVAISNPTRNVTFTLNATGKTARFYGYTGTYSDMQIESGSTATAYEPYSNICPISGHTQVEVGDVGKNLFDPTDIISGKRLTNLTGNAYNSTNDAIADPNFFVSSLIKVTQGNVVTKNSPNEDAYHRWHIYDGNGICVRYTSDNVITIGSGESYVALCGVNSEINTTLIRQGYQVTVNLGGTYYSGTLDVVSGVLTIDKKGITIVGNTATWIKSTSPSIVAGRAGYYTSGNAFDGCAYSGGDTNPNHVVIQFNCAESGLSAVQVVPSEKFAIGIGTSSGYTGIWVNVSNSIATVEDFKTYLNSNPIQAVYPLANPTPIQLSPTMVKALVGENHLSAPLDGQEITESKYKQMFTFDDVIAYIQSLS